MNMAWGGICANNMVSLNISENHKTSANIKLKGAFTISVPDVTHIGAHNENLLHYEHLFLFQFVKFN